MTDSIFSQPPAPDFDSAADALAIGDIGPCADRPAAFALRNPLVSRRGFTLVEVLIAMTLLTLGVFAVLGTQTVALQSNSIASQLSVANKLAASVLEDILGWDPTLAVFQTTNTTGIQYAGFPVVSGSNTTYTGTSWTDPNSGVYSATYKIIIGTSGNGVPVGVTRIAVTVSYAYKGATKTVVVYGSKVTA